MVRRSTTVFASISPKLSKAGQDIGHTCIHMPRKQKSNENPYAWTDEGQVRKSVLIFEEPKVLLQ